MPRYGEGSCFNCGEPTTDFDHIGRTRVHICDDMDCHRELEREQRVNDEYRREDEEIDRQERRAWGY